MTPREHTAQRDRVAGSLRADDTRETHRAVYPVRKPSGGWKVPERASELVTRAARPRTWS